MNVTLLVSLLGVLSQGQVSIPLDVYHQLMESARNPASRPALGFALGSASVSVRVATASDRSTAEVSVTLPFEVFEDQWVLVPVLPPGAPVERATLSGNPVALVATPQGLSLATNVKGSHSLELGYRVDATSSERGYVLALPVPPAASLKLEAVLPATGLDVTVLPAAGVRTSESGKETHIQATVPSTTGVQIAWRTPASKGPSISRAVYRGELSGSSILWRAELRVDVFENETAVVPLLPRDLALESLAVDGKEAPILVEGSRFATVMRGAGTHVVTASFRTPVLGSDGPPRTELALPEIPVSRVELRLPGRKEVSASPPASVSTRARNGGTEATVHFPLTAKATLSWSEAIPEAARRELRANASIYHVFHADEGVLYGRAHVVYEVQHGGTNRLELALPPRIEVNQVTSGTGAIADWRVSSRGRRRILRVFLDRELTGALTFSVDYDRSLVATGPETLPLLEAQGVGRQRGMVALVPSRDRALNPAEEGTAARVGENQLPPFVRETIERTVAHTFKYAEAPPAIRVLAAVPERTAGRFDAEVDTLVSLGEVAVHSTASVEIHVKSGGLDRLELAIPPGASLLNLVAPSLRAHRQVDSVVEIELTQEMEGDFRIEATYEKLLPQGAAELDAATVRVRGADVEQGRIAIEASSSVEIAPLAIEELSPLDVRELPRRLLLQTSHPILQAYRYVRAEPAPRLTLALTRHPAVEVQEAVVDRAEHRTLVTRDGLAVTTSTFTVRNRVKQFLKVRLPEASEIWSVFVDGRAEKPALSESAEEGPSYLVKIVSSTDGFPVEIVYATRIPPIGFLGTVRGHLPRPDLLVTDSRWDWYLPEGMDYGTPRTRMKVVVEEGRLPPEELAELEKALGVAEAPDPLRLHVPAAGIHFAFELLYANHGDAEASVAIPYSSRGGKALAQGASLLGVLLSFLGIRRRLLVLGAGGAILALAPLALYGASPLPALTLTAALAAASFRYEIRRALARRRASPAEVSG